MSNCSSSADPSPEDGVPATLSEGEYIVAAQTARAHTNRVIADALAAINEQAARDDD
jgi:hypothetical protein